MSDRVYDEINSWGHGVPEGDPKSLPGGCRGIPRLRVPYLSIIIDEPAGVRGGYGNSNLMHYTNGCDAESFMRRKLEIRV